MNKKTKESIKTSEIEESSETVAIATEPERKNDHDYVYYAVGTLLIGGVGYVLYKIWGKNRSKPQPEAKKPEIVIKPPVKQDTRDPHD